MKNSELYCIVFALLTTCHLEAQVSINNTGNAPDSSAMLDVQSTDQGVLLPRLTTAQRNAIVNPAPGLVIYNLDHACFNYYNGGEWILDCGRFEASYQNQYLAPDIYGGAGDEEGLGICLDAFGNRYLTGVFQDSISFGDFTFGSVENTTFIVKQTATNQTLWGQSVEGVSTGKDIQSDGKGNLYVLGDFQGTISILDTSLVSAGVTDIYLLKLDEQGQLQWAWSAGDTAAEIAHELSLDPEGNIFLTASFYDTLNIGDTTLVSSGYSDVMIAKITPSGQLDWVRQAGGMSHDQVSGITTDTNGNCYITGNTGSSSFSIGDTSISNAGISVGYIAKLSSTGALIWASQFGGDINNGRAIVADPAGNIYVTGTFELSFSIGDTSFNSNGSIDMFTAKLDPQGELIWVQHAGLASNEAPEAIDINNEGQCFVTGYFFSTAIFGDTTVTAAGSPDLFLVSYENDGQFLWVNTVSGGGSSAHYGRDVVTGLNDICHITGSFYAQTYLGGDTTITAGSRDILVMAVNGPDGNTMVSLPAGLSSSYDADTDQTNELQSLVLNSTQLSISDGNSVDLASINTDDQTLGLIGTQLSITDGNSVDLVGLKDNLGNHSATQTLNLNGNYLSGDGGNEGIFVDASGNVGLGTDSPAEQLHLTGGSILLEGSSKKITFKDVRLGSALPIGTMEFNNTDDNSSNSEYIAASISVYNAGTSDDGDLRFATASDLVLSEHMRITNEGDVGIGTTSPGSKLDVVGTITASAFIGDGSGLTNLSVPGDDLGNHTAAQAINLAYNDITNGDTITATAFIGDGSGLTGTGDNLGNHTATQSFNLNGNFLSGDGDNEGLRVDAQGNVSLSAEDPVLVFRDTTGSNGPRKSEIRNTFKSVLGASDPDDQSMDFYVSDNSYDGVSHIMTLRGDGKVGIGTSTPAAKLDIAATGDGASVLRLSTERAWEFQQENTGSASYLRLRNINGPNKHFSIDTDGKTNFRTQDGSTTLVTVDHGTGNLGIGTDNPTNGKLQILGQSGSVNLSYGYLNSTGSTGTSSSTTAYSIYASNRIAAQEFRAHSDVRIKDVKGTSIASDDLETLMQIEVTDYILRDTVANGKTPQKKVIAQQVAKVYPQAVTKNLTEVVPDIYQRAEIQDGWIMLPTDLETGERVKIITEQSSEIYVVTEADPHRFRVNLPPTANSQQLTANSQQPVFVYGREVDDFHTVDYEAIAMLNVSATQEQQRRIEKLEAENLMLRADLKSLTTMVQQIQQSVAGN